MTEKGIYQEKLTFGDWFFNGNTNQTWDNQVQIQKLGKNGFFY